MSGNHERRAPLRTGAEQDVVTSWRKLYAYTKRAGVTAGVKRQIRRRERHEHERDTRDRARE